MKAAAAATEYMGVPTRVARLTGTSLAGPINRVATFSVGVGFDAAVVEAAERKPYAKLRFGGVYYASTALSRLTSDWRTPPSESANRSWRRNLRCARCLDASPRSVHLLWSHSTAPREGPAKRYGNTWRWQTRIPERHKGRFPRRAPSPAHREFWNPSMD